MVHVRLARKTIPRHDMTLFPKSWHLPAMCCFEYSLEACHGDVGLAVFKRHRWSLYERKIIKITVNTHTRL
jgi:hypothetical protein